MATRQFLHSNPVLVAHRREAMLWCLQKFSNEILEGPKMVSNATVQGTMISSAGSFSSSLINHNIQAASSRQWPWDCYGSESHAMILPLPSRLIRNRRHRSVQRRMLHGNGETGDGREELHKENGKGQENRDQDGIIQGSSIEPSEPESTADSHLQGLDTSINSIDSQPVHDSDLPSPDLENLKSIIATKNYSQIQLSWTLVQKILSDPTEVDYQLLLQDRKQLYEYYLESQSDQCYEWILSIISQVHPRAIRKYDFESKILVFLRTNELMLLPQTLAESLTYMSKANCLDLMEFALSHLINMQVPDRHFKCFDIFSSLILRIHGDLELLHRSKFQVERRILNELIDQLDNDNVDIIDILRRLMSQNRVFGSMLATSCLDLFFEKGDFDKVIGIWDLKDSQTTASSVDLHRAMRAYLHKSDYGKSLKIYQNHQYLQQDFQFDVVLELYAKLQDWTGMQQMFESLFGRGELPNLKHYSIVMNAISRLGRVDIVDTMFKGLLGRGMSPSRPIFHALMYARLALGDTKGVEEYFHKMESFGITRDQFSYTILLMAYRDSLDLQPALDLVTEMYNNNQPITVGVMTVLLSICTERRDSATAKQIFDWMVSYGIVPNAISYNALIAAYVESNEFQSAETTYREMINAGLTPGIDTITTLLNGYARFAREDKVHALYKEIRRYNLYPDSHCYASILWFLCRKKRTGQARMMFKEMENSGVPPNAYHYSILMNAFCTSKDFHLVFRFYKEMGDKGIAPTFRTHAVVMRAIMNRARSKGKLAIEQAEVFLQDFLGANGKEVVDLTSEHLPRNEVPPDMFKDVVRSYTKTSGYMNARLLLQQFDESSRDKVENNITMLKLLIDLHGSAQEWHAVSVTWIKLMEQISRRFNKSSSSLNGEQSSKSVIPYRYRNSIHNAIDYKVDQLRIYGKQHDLLNFVDSLERVGFELDNSNLNKVIQGLLETDDTMESGLMLAEKILMKGHKMRTLARRQRRSHILPKNVTSPWFLSKHTIRNNTLSMVRQRLDSLQEIICQQENCTLEKAAMIIARRYPDLLQLSRSQLMKEEIGEEEFQNDRFEGVRPAWLN